MERNTLLKRSMFATVFALAWPTILEQFLTTIIQYVDTAMVGHISAAASATVGLSTPLGWVIDSPMLSAGVAALVTVSKALGQGNERQIKTAANQAFIMILVIALVEGIITLSVSPFFPAWMGAENAIRRDASIYFAIICAPMLFRVMIIIGGMVIRATGDTRTPMIINIVMNLVNILLNYLLINNTHSIQFGDFSLQIPGAGWGAIGAGVATAVSFVVGGSLMFAAFCRNKRLGFSLRGLRYDREVMSGCVRLAVPMGANRVFTCVGYVVFAGMVSGMGTVTFAAHTIANTAESLFYIPGYGMQTSASTLAGFAWGRNDERMFKSVVRVTVGMVFVIMSISGGVLFAFAESLMELFSEDEEVILLGAQVLRIVAVSEPLFGTGVVMTGLFNGVGNTRFPLIAEISCMWGVRILFTYLCIHVFHLGLNAVWYCMVASNVMLAVIFTIRMCLPNVFKKSKETSVVMQQ